MAGGAALSDGRAAALLGGSMAIGRLVAVIKGPDGALGDPSGGGRVEFWARTGDAWAVERTLDFEPLSFLGPGRGAEPLARLASELSRAAVVAAKGFGSAFQALLKAGPTLCEMPEFEPSWLDDILQAALDPSWDDETASPTPVESPPGSGVFELDLSAALAVDPELTPERVLGPFLENVPFLELRILFGHYPAWLERELARRGLSCRLERRGPGTLMIISPEPVGRG